MVGPAGRCVLPAMDPLVTHRERDTGLEALLAFIRDARFSKGVRCPRCEASHVQRWGTFSGRQRYRCRGKCGRTFSDLTGTPAAYIKKLTLWPAHSRCMAEGLSLRSVASRLGVHVSTAFRWRHRTLEGFRIRDAETLTGWIELGSEWFPESRKGRRVLDRPPRRRGIPRYWVFGPPHRKVLVACDREAHVVTALLAGRRLSASELTRLLGDRIQGRATVVAKEGVLGDCARFARSRGLEYRDGRSGSSGSGGLAHVRNAWACGRRLKRWMMRFRGVATRYLQNYLIWHRQVDAAERRGIGVDALRWPLHPLGP